MKLDGQQGVISHFLMDVRARNRTDYTMISYSQRLAVLTQLLLSLCQITEIEQVKVIHLRLCVQHLLDVGYDNPSGARPLDANTVRGYVRVWKAFFNWCYQEELIDVNVVARLKSPDSVKRVIPAFTVENIQKMLEVCDVGTDLGFRNYVILLLFLDTGMRLSELCGLDVDSVNGTFVKILGKGRKEREVGIRPEVSKLIWKYVQKYRIPKQAGENALFLTHGRRITVGCVKAVLADIKRQSGIEGVRVSAHTFRHTFAKLYLKKGGELFKLSRELGHSSVKITEVYLKDFDSSDARDVHNDYSPISLLHLGQKKRKRKNDLNK